MKKLLLISLCINAGLILSFVGKRAYYSSKSNPVVANDSMVTYSYNRIKADAATVSFYQMLPNCQTDIIFFGTSLTQGFPLQEMFGNVTLRNRGIGGNTCEALLKRVGEVAEGYPSKVFIEAGINDVTSGDTPKEIIASIDSICQVISCASPDTKIYLQTILPTTYSNAKYNSLINDYNQSLKAYCCSSNFTYINTHDVFLNGKEMDASLTTDGIHLNGKGYFKWKAILEPYLR